MKNYLDVFLREMKNRNYSRKTIKVYSWHLKQFLDFSRKFSLDPAERIAVYLEKEQKSDEQRRLAWSSIKLFYHLVLQKECPYKLSRVKGRKRLPDVLTRDEILIILQGISNLKHRMLISMLYGK